MSHVRIFEHVLNDEPVDTFDYAYMRRVHRQLFGDIYDWAGQPRVVPETAMTKRGPDVVNHEVGDPDAPTVAYRYYPGPKVAEAADNLYSRLAAEDYLTGLGQRRRRSPVAVLGRGRSDPQLPRGQHPFAVRVLLRPGPQRRLQPGSAGPLRRTAQRVRGRTLPRPRQRALRPADRAAHRTVTPRRSLELTGREYRWAASLMEQVERTQRAVDPPDSGLEL